MADEKRTTVAEITGTEKKRFVINLPKKLAHEFGQNTITINEERDGIDSREFLFWQAFYQLRNEAADKRNR